MAAIRGNRCRGMQSRISGGHLSYKTHTAGHNLVVNLLRVGEKQIHTVPKPTDKRGIETVWVRTQSIQPNGEKSATDESQCGCDSSKRNEVATRSHVSQVFDEVQMQTGRKGNLRSITCARSGGLHTTVFVAGLLLLGLNAQAALPVVEPQTIGLDPQKLAAIDAVVADGISEKKMPGCVVCLGRHGKVAWLKAFGNKQVEPAVVPMSTDTVFDMASLTKPVATATSIMLLIERGKLSLSDKVSALIPEFAVNEKEEITIRDLLIHQSGLIADNAMADYQNGPDDAMQKIYALKLQNPVGTKFVYSDVNFILLGELVKRVSGQSVHEFSQKEIFEPLGMRETGYLPNAERKARAAPTQKRDGRWIQGEVHDPRAFKLEGIAGHAGLFSTAEDAAIYASMMLGSGRIAETQILKPETVALMTQSNRVSSGIRGLGWDKQTSFSINKGESLTESAYGHGGFTGTVLWIDPELDLFFVFLSNRVHPDGKGSVNQLAGKLATIAASSVMKSAP